MKGSEIYPYDRKYCEEKGMEIVLLEGYKQITILAIFQILRNRARGSTVSELEEQLDKVYASRKIPDFLWTIEKCPEPEGKTDLEWQLRLMTSRGLLRKIADRYHIQEHSIEFSKRKENKKALDLLFDPRSFLLYRSESAQTS